MWNKLYKYTNNTVDHVTQGQPQQDGVRLLCFVPAVWSSGLQVFSHLPLFLRMTNIRVKRKKAGESRWEQVRDDMRIGDAWDEMTVCCHVTEIFLHAVLVSCCLLILSPLWNLLSSFVPVVFCISRKVFEKVSNQDFTTCMFKHFSFI